MLKCFKWKYIIIFIGSVFILSLVCIFSIYLSIHFFSWFVLKNSPIHSFSLDASRNIFINEFHNFSTCKQDNELTNNLQRIYLNDPNTVFNFGNTLFDSNCSTDHKFAIYLYMEIVDRDKHNSNKIISNLINLMKKSTDKSIINRSALLLGLNTGLLNVSRYQPFDEIVEIGNFDTIFAYLDGVWTSLGVHYKTHGRVEMPQFIAVHKEKILNILKKHNASLAGMFY